MADAPTLQVEPRTVQGKKVRWLRRSGIVPANVFGRGLESVAVQAPLPEFRRVFRGVSRNAVVQLQIAGEAETRPVVLRQVQRHPVSGAVQHIDLYQIDVTRRIHSQAALVLVGQSEVVALGGVLVQSLDSVLIEALPLEMLAEFEVDISVLTQFGQSVHVGDLQLPPSVRALTDANAQIVTVVAPRLVEEEEEAEEEVAVVAAEGEEAAEGAETPTAEEDGTAGSSE
ncbi:MAG: 50S ribosomal protein L25 [Dehalococcoidia bacterium]